MEFGSFYRRSIKLGSIGAARRSGGLFRPRGLDWRALFFVFLLFVLLRSFLSFFFFFLFVHFPSRFVRCRKRVLWPARRRPKSNGGRHATDAEVLRLGENMHRRNERARQCEALPIPEGWHGGLADKGNKCLWSNVISEPLQMKVTNLMGVNWIDFLATNRLIDKLTVSWLCNGRKHIFIIEILLHCVIANAEYNFNKMLTFLMLKFAVIC